MMRQRSSKTSHSLLDLAKVGKGRQLRTTKELSRNSERRTINGLGDRETSVILVEESQSDTPAPRGI